MFKEEHVNGKESEIAAYTSGCGTVEFYLLLGIMVPVFFGLSMLGKLTDLNQTNEQASRYATWEATVYNRAQLVAQQPDTIERRFFGAANQHLSSQRQNNETATQNRLWGSTSGASSGVRKAGDVVRSANHSASTSYSFDTGKADIAVAAGHAAATVGSLLDDFSGNSWGLVADGMLQSTVELPLHTTSLLHAEARPCGVVKPDAAQSDQSEDGGFACVSSSGVILADGWSSSGDAQAISRIRSLVPTSLLEPIGNILGTLGGTVFPELGSLNGAFGHVDMSVLPAYATE